MILRLRQYLSVAFFALISLESASTLHAQEKHLIQVKTFDAQLKAVSNIEVSLNNRDYILIGNKGIAFVELPDKELPLKSVKIKNEELEAASWNYTKGIVEIIIRKRNYRLIKYVVRNESNMPIPNLKMTFKGKKISTLITNDLGRVEIPLALDEKNITQDQFVINQYKIINLRNTDGENILIVDKIKVTPEISKVMTNEKYFKDFSLSKIDSIQSLTAFYAVFKNYQIKNMSVEVRLKVEAKFNSLVQQLQDSVHVILPLVGRITDSSFVADDIKNLLLQATIESDMLKAQRNDFDLKVNLISEKFGTSIKNLDASKRKQLLSDLTSLEKLMVQNESRFYINQNDYRQIINSLKEKFFDYEHVELKLSESERQRLDDQTIFSQRLLIILSVVFLFAMLIIMLVFISFKLRKQKKQLEIANGEVKRINENLEHLVTKRTSMLADALQELDTFLYRASHDLRSPICSIIGLCNIAGLESNHNSEEILQRVVDTTLSMDRLLKKLSIISEINQPSSFSSISLTNMLERIEDYFKGFITNNQIQFIIDCPRDLNIYSNQHLIRVILVSLVENALFYSALKNSTDARIEVKAFTKNNQFKLSVYDNGLGVDNAINPKLFDMFFKGSEHSKGHGLGLYIAEKAVQALNGTIKVESELGRFTKFDLSFPIYARL